MLEKNFSDQQGGSSGKVFAIKPNNRPFNFYLKIKPFIYLVFIYVDMCVAHTHEVRGQSLFSIQVINLMAREVNGM